MKEKLKRYWIPLTAALLMAGGLAAAKSVFRAENGKAVMNVLSDSFCVPGFILSGVALLSWVGTFGTFDMLNYGLRSFFGHFIPPLSADLPRHFADFRAQKNEKGRVWLKEFLFTGLGCLGLSILFLVLWFLF